MRRSRITSAVGVSLLAAACGSTVQASRSAGDSGLTTAGGGLDAPPAATGSAGPNGTVVGAAGGPTGTGTALGAAVGSVAGGAGGPGGSANPGSTAALVGPGVSAT